MKWYQSLASGHGLECSAPGLRTPHEEAVDGCPKRVGQGHTLSRGEVETPHDACARQRGEAIGGPGNPAEDEETAATFPRESDDVAGAELSSSALAGAATELPMLDCATLPASALTANPLYVVS